MSRRFIVWLFLLAFSVQAPLALAAADRLMESNCQTSDDASMTGMHKTCCPEQKAAMKCSFDGCLSATPILGAHQSPTALVVSTQSTLTPQIPARHFSSRGDSPLIRPPIL